MPKTLEYMQDGNDIEDHELQIPDSNGQTPDGSGGLRDYPKIRGTLTALVDAIIMEGSKTSELTGSAFDLEASFRETECLLGSVTAYLQSAVLSNQRQRAFQHNIRQAISQLPAELLVMIFEMALPPEDEDDNYYAELSALSSVYSRWREVTKHTASLWCMINATHSPEMVDLIFHRSMDGPLDVDFDSTWLAKSAPTRYGHDLFTRCMGEVHRWRSLRLRTDDMSVLARVSGLMAPRLDEFYISWFDVHSTIQDELPRQTLLLPSSPALTKLDLDVIAIQAGIVPNTLRHLSFSNMALPSSYLRHILQANIGLQTLSLWHIIVNDNSTESRSRIYLSKLQELSLCSSPEAVADLIEAIQAPNLRMLEVVLVSPLPAHPTPQEEIIMAGFRSFCGVPDSASLDISFTPDGDALVSSVGLDKDSRDVGFSQHLLNSCLHVSYTARPMDITLSQLKDTYKDNEMALVPLRITVAKSETLHDDVIQSLQQFGHVKTIHLRGGLIQSQFIAHLGSPLPHSPSSLLSKSAHPHPHLRTLYVSDLTVDGVRGLADMVQSRHGHAASSTVGSVSEQASRLPARFEYVSVSGIELGAFHSSFLLDLTTSLGDGVLRIAYETQDGIISNVPAPISHGLGTIMVAVSAPKELGGLIVPTIPSGYRLAPA